MEYTVYFCKNATADTYDVVQKDVTTPGGGGGGEEEEGVYHVLEASGQGVEGGECGLRL